MHHSAARTRGYRACQHSGTGEQRAHGSASDVPVPVDIARPRVATFLGALVSYSFVVGGLTLLIWISIFYLTRKSSVAGISAIVLSNFFLLLFCDDISVKLSILLLSIFILFKHSENIKRLLRKEELSFEGRDKN